MLDWSTSEPRHSTQFSALASIRRRARNALAWYQARPHIDGPVNWSHLVNYGLSLALDTLARRDLPDGGDWPDAADRPLKPGPGRGAMNGAWTRRRVMEITPDAAEQLDDPVRGNPRRAL